jgi:hypothetical protein
MSVCRLVMVWPVLNEWQRQQLIRWRSTVRTVVLQLVRTSRRFGFLPRRGWVLKACWAGLFSDSVSLPSSRFKKNFSSTVWPLEMGPVVCPETSVTNHQPSGFGGLGVSVLASGNQVRGLKPSRSRRIFKGEKILSRPSFGREAKPWVPCRRFAACKRSLDVPWKSAFQQNWSVYPPLISSNFCRWSAERIGRRGGII